jgi:hypothetical protein
MAADRPEYVEIAGVAYMRCGDWQGNPMYMRYSAPLDRPTGKRTRQPLRYPVDALPPHTVITREQAEAMNAASVAAFAARYGHRAPTNPGRHPDAA